MTSAYFTSNELFKHVLLTNYVYKCIRSKWTISLYVDRSNKQNNIPVWNLEQFLDILSWKKKYEVNNTGISDDYKPTTVDKPHLFNDGPFCSPNGFNNHCDNFSLLKGCLS